MKSSPFAVAIALALARSLEALAADPTAKELLQKYDDVMAPATFDAIFVMVAHRQDDTVRSYKFRSLKAQDDKVRMWFSEPASAKGQEMLRVGDNMWVYMPNLKRSVRIASRDAFQGGDFVNGDMMRVNYVADYDGKVVPSGDPKLYLLELTAKSQESTYGRIKLWFTVEKRLPAKAEYYAASGKLLRSATFSAIKSFHGLERPSSIVMRNELATKRYSELTTIDIKPNVETPAQKFVLDDLGR